MYLVEKRFSSFQNATHSNEAPPKKHLLEGVFSRETMALSQRERETTT